MNRGYVILLLSFLGYLLLQVLIFRNVALFDMSFCFVYVAILLLFPLETNRIVFLATGFFTGLLVDVFYNSLGIHAFAGVFLCYIRYYWLQLITPQGGYESNMSPTLHAMGFTWFFTYALPIIFLHQIILFYVEIGFDHFWFTFLKVLLSTLFTFTVVVLIQALFYKKIRS